ncbi:MAG: hypothetical protein K1X67_17525 [Fimbriimonadaceae bacterium]|nr:hypothetical protein [Fimbriimonadaceae bacterium]
MLLGSIGDYAAYHLEVLKGDLEVSWMNGKTEMCVGTPLQCDTAQMAERVGVLLGLMLREELDWCLHECEGRTAYRFADCELDITWSRSGHVADVILDIGYWDPVVALTILNSMSFVGQTNVEEHQSGKWIRFDVFFRDTVAIRAWLNCSEEDDR